MKPTCSARLRPFAGRPVPWPWSPAARRPSSARRPRCRSARQPFRAPRRVPRPACRSWPAVRPAASGQLRPACAGAWQPAEPAVGPPYAPRPEARSSFQRRLPCGPSGLLPSPVTVVSRASSRKPPTCQTPAGSRFRGGRTLRGKPVLCRLDGARSAPHRVGAAFSLNGVGTSARPEVWVPGGTPQPSGLIIARSARAVTGPSAAALAREG